MEVCTTTAESEAKYSRYMQYVLEKVGDDDLNATATIEYLSGRIDAQKYWLHLMPPHLEEDEKFFEAIEGIKKNPSQVEKLLSQLCE